MMMAPAPLEPAPLYEEVAEGPPGGRAYWLHCADDTRIRIGVWSPEAARATVLMFPGRTEYVEKYGRVAAEFARAGLATVSVDWRGQGLADRPDHRYDMGHVEGFDEYRHDVAAIRGVLSRLDLPEPCFLVAHSMGGAIGLRALHDGLPARRAVFTAPMWGIRMGLPSRMAVRVLGRVSGVLGIDRSFAPTTGPVKPMEFDGNMLTTDRDQFDYMARQVEKHPNLALGGPSIRWLLEALHESQSLVDMAPPDLPTLCFLGSREKIVDVDAIRTRMADWPGGELIEIDGAEHEVLMEAPAMRAPILERIESFFAEAL